MSWQQKIEREGKKVAIQHKTEAVVFHVHTATHTLDMIGIPFEYRGEVFAVHRPVHHSPFNARFVVSHVATGLAIPGIQQYTIDAAREAAIAYLDANTEKFATLSLRIAKKSYANRATARETTQ